MPAQRGAGAQLFDNSDKTFFFLIEPLSKHMSFHKDVEITLP